MIETARCHRVHPDPIDPVAGAERSRPGTVDSWWPGAHRIGVTSAALDRLLAVLVVALAVTGLVSLRMGAASGRLAVRAPWDPGRALAVTVAWKIGRSLPRAIRARRWGRVVLGLLVSLATAAALVGGFAWVAGGRLLSIGAWTVLTFHAWIGLALIPLVLIHLAPRRWRLLVPRFGAVAVGWSGARS